MRCVRFFSAVALAAAVLAAGPDADRGSARAAAVSPPAGSTLAPHKATYRLTLLRTVKGEGVRMARGSMVYSLSDRCDGYTIESDVAMELSYSDGNTQKVDQRYAAWEAKDGRSSTFSMQTLENDQPAKKYQGTISLNADGSGTATYESEKPVTFQLPKGTLLSTAHTRMLLEQAAAGKKFFRGNVIDGSFEQGPFVVTALISGSRQAEPVSEKSGALGAGRYWPMSLAYFPAASKDATPEYELGMDLLPSGISRAMVQDFGAFAIGFTLTDLEPLKPEC